VSDLAIEPAGVDDVPFLKRMQWEAVLSSPWLISRYGLEALREKEEEIWSGWPSEHEAAFVARLPDHTNCGAIMLRAQQGRGSGIEGFRLVIAVDSTTRGQGIGRQLLRRAREYAQAAGASYLYLEVDPANGRAIGLYRSEGYAEVGRAELLSMRLELSQ